MIKGSSLPLQTCDILLGKFFCSRSLFSLKYVALYVATPLALQVPPCNMRTVVKFDRRAFRRDTIALLIRFRCRYPSKGRYWN